MEYANLLESPDAWEPKNRQMSPGFKSIENLEWDRTKIPARDGDFEQRGNASSQVQQSTQKPLSGEPAKATENADLQSPHSISPNRTGQYSGSNRQSASKQPDLTPCALYDLESIKQVASNLKTIYAGLCTTEEYCKAFISDFAKNGQSSQDWEKLTYFHQTLLEEYHKSFFASQNPSVNHLPRKHEMPERIWCSGIQPILDFLQTRLPDSEEYMVQFMCLAYHRIVSLSKTVPYLKDKWAQLLVDIETYHKALNEGISFRIAMSLHELGTRE